MKMERIAYGDPTHQILAIPDHYVAIGHKQEKAMEVTGCVTKTEDGRFLVKAGTIFPANDGTAIGVVLNDYDVTDGDQQMAIVIHGFILSAKLPEEPSAGAISALKQITFIKKRG